MDVISWHHYPEEEPELSLPATVAVRDVMRRHSTLDKPLWNTEGKVGGDPNIGDPKDHRQAPTDERARAAVARAYLTQWAMGVRLFCWYIWDEADHVVCIKLSRSTSASAKPDYALLTPAGEAYKKIAQWLVGARMVSKQIDPAGQGQRWVIEISREGGYRGWIVWQTQGTSNYPVPKPWSVRQVRQLDGARAPAAQDRIGIGPVPVLLENQAVQ